jgi:hypothetical protein
MRKRMTIALAALAFGTVQTAMAQDALPLDACTPPSSTLSGFDQPKPALKLGTSGARVAGLTPRQAVVRDGSIAGFVGPDGPQSAGNSTDLVGAGVEVGTILAVGLTVRGVRAAVHGVDALIDSIDDDQ